jgi:hypothetical protein
MYGKTGFATQKDYNRARYLTQKAEREKAKQPDPISLLSDVERAYIAGLVDADGSIYAAAVGPKRDKTVYPIVVVAMTHKPVIDWLCKTIGGKTKARLHNQTNLRRYPYMKPQYRFQIFGKRAKLLCETMLPFMRVKDEQARLVTTFPTDARIAPGVTIDMSEINATRFALRDQINGLNHVNGRQTVPVEKRKFFGAA